MNDQGSDSQPARVFAAVAVDASESLVRALEALKRLGRQIRPARANQLHVTLKFFGDVDAATVSNLCDGIDVIARRTTEFDWSVRGMGAFRTKPRPKVIWAGANNASPMVEIADSLAELGETYGFVRERRVFRPHVTLARVRDRPPRELQRIFDEFADEDFGAQRTSTIILYRSVLEPHGPVYHPLHIATLRPTEATTDATSNDRV